MISSVLATKFHQPALHPRRVRRPRLVQRLTDGLEAGSQVTLISAPAGFGKSTCVSEWLTDLPRPSVWLSLEKSDDDLTRFVTYFIAALQRVDEQIGQTLEPALQSGQAPPRDVILTSLINDILRVDVAFVLVLDDFHVLHDEAVLQLLERMIANQPAQLHLALVTREDPLLPLARLRANNRLTEIRAADLRFTEGETQRFMQETMGLPLTPADIAALEERTEGWIVGLQLAGLSMRGRSDPAAFIASLRGSHRHILSYLTEEVLQRQPAAIQQFLLHTSILERMSAELCDAILKDDGGGEEKDEGGRMKDCPEGVPWDEESQAADGASSPSLHPSSVILPPSSPSLHPSAFILALLDRTNLFLVPLDDDGQWYRYHHLFAELLRSQQSRVPKERLVLLHGRASQWFAQAGMIPEAIEHALAAGDYPRAVDLLESHIMLLISHGYTKAVEGWMQVIPAEWHTHNPRANLAFGWMHLYRGNYGQVTAYLERAAAAIDRAGQLDSAALRGEHLALQANLLHMQGQGAGALQAARSALTILEPEDRFLRGLVYLGMGGAYRQLDDLAASTEAYLQSIEDCRASGNVIPEVLGASALALMSVQHGRLHFAVQVGTRAIEHLERPGEAPLQVVGGVHGTLGIVYYEWNQVEPARAHLQRALQLSNLVGHNASQIYIRVALARTLQAEGDLNGAEQTLQEAVALQQMGAPAWLWPEVAAQQVRLALARGNPLAAEAVLAQHGLAVQGELSIPERLGHPTELLYLAYLRLGLFRLHADPRSADLPAALALADRLVEATLAGQRINSALQALLLRARLHAAAGDTPASLADLRRALEIGQPEGYVRTFVDEDPLVGGLLRESLASGAGGEYAHQLLAAFPAAEPAARHAREGALDALTERELDVLRLIAEGLKYEEIATRLVITVNTVRFYVKEIYAKLHVNNRTKAVAAARDVDLL